LKVSALHKSPGVLATMCAWSNPVEHFPEEHRYFALGQEGRQTIPLGWPASLGCMACLSFCCACAYTLGNRFAQKPPEMLAMHEGPVLCNPHSTPAQLCPGGALCPPSGVRGCGAAPTPPAHQPAFCNPLAKDPPQLCPGGIACPSSGRCGGPDAAPTPSPTIPLPKVCFSPACHSKPERKCTGRPSGAQRH